LDWELSHVFWKLIKKSVTVFCWIGNPRQKSQIVNFLKSKNSEICLAIGDGGNDVNMIKAANNGVGIFGKE
jgi:P-type E1-E2 ATPase